MKRIYYSYITIGVIVAGVGLLAYNSPKDAVDAKSAPPPSSVEQAAAQQVPSAQRPAISQNLLEAMVIACSPKEAPFDGSIEKTVFFSKNRVSSLVTPVAQGHIMEDLSVMWVGTYQVIGSTVELKYTTKVNPGVEVQGILNERRSANDAYRWQVLPQPAAGYTATKSQAMSAKDNVGWKDWKGSSNEICAVLEQGDKLTQKLEQQFRQSVGQSTMFLISKFGEDIFGN